MLLPRLYMQLVSVLCILFLCTVHKWAIPPALSKTVSVHDLLSFWNGLDNNKKSWPDTVLDKAGGKVHLCSVSGLSKTNGLCVVCHQFVNFFCMELDPSDYPLGNVEKGMLGGYYSLILARYPPYLTCIQGYKRIGTPLITKWYLGYIQLSHSGLDDDVRV